MQLCRRQGWFVEARTVMHTSDSTPHSEALWYRFDRRRPEVADTTAQRSPLSDGMALSKLWNGVTRALLSAHARIESGQACRKRGRAEQSQDGNEQNTGARAMTI